MIVHLLLENIESQLQILNMENKDVYIMGDFNLNLMNYDCEDKVKNFVDLMNSSGLFSLITKPILAYHKIQLHS